MDVYKVSMLKFKTDTSMGRDKRQLWYADPYCNLPPVK